MDTERHSEASGDFAARAAGERRVSLLRGLGRFLRDSKKWWLTPIVVFVLLFGALVLLWGTDAGPFIYSVF